MSVFERLRDRAARLVAGVTSRECGLVGPRAPGEPEQLDDAVPVGRDAAGGLIQWMPPRPGVSRTVLVDELDPAAVHPTLWGKSAVLHSLMRATALDAEGREVEAPVFEGSALGADIGPLPGLTAPRSMTIEVRDPKVASTMHHLMWCLVISMHVIALGGPSQRFPALPPSTLLRCMRCNCVLGNPEDMPASAGYYRCTWCCAVDPWLDLPGAMERAHSAAAVLWGSELVEVCEGMAERARAAGVEIAAFPPPGVFRRPVTAPTLLAYRPGPGVGKADR